MPNANNQVTASSPSLSLSEAEDKLIDVSSNVRRSIARRGLDYGQATKTLGCSAIKHVLREYSLRMKPFQTFVSGLFFVSMLALKLRGAAAVRGRKQQISPSPPPVSGTKGGSKGVVPHQYLPRFV